MIDLHCHSIFSDGILSPEALLLKAEEAGISLLALTDHDTLEGSKVLLRENKNQALSVISGVELSTRWKKHDIHILGYRMDLDNQSLNELMEKQKNSRHVRAQEIGEKMGLTGINDAFIKACELAGHNCPGRPHFAQVYLNEGMVSDRQAAFRRFLGRGKPAYVATAWITVEEAAQVISRAGGQAVIAHPLKYGLTRTRLQELIVDFREAGGCGIEVVSGEMTSTQIKELAGLCLRYQLLASSGSDYHGDTLSRISLGRQAQLPVNCMPVWHQWNI